MIGGAAQRPRVTSREHCKDPARDRSELRVQKLVAGRVTAFQHCGDDRSVLRVHARPIEAFVGQSFGIEVEQGREVIDVRQEAREEITSRLGGCQRSLECLQSEIMRVGCRLEWEGVGVYGGKSAIRTVAMGPRNAHGGSVARG
ncbi:MAG: hypothetical protein QOC79_2948 [Actinomycetota bacterium]|nr:hypothetical protein [Actinomycetota bacterium]